MLYEIALEVTHYHFPNALLFIELAPFSVTEDYTKGCVHGNKNQYVRFWTLAFLRASMVRKWPHDYGSHWSVTYNIPQKYRSTVVE